MRAVRLIIRGRVQGVGYRAWAVDSATRLGLAGWVRNRVDGTVEAIAKGDAAALDRFAAACRTGPRLAQVTAVVVTEADPTEAGGPGFEHRPTV
jgi:acylphosphatase